MFQLTGSLQPNHLGQRLATALLALVIFGSLQFSAAVPICALEPQEEASGRLGYLVDVQLPLIGQRDEEAKQQIRGILDSADASSSRPVIVLRFAAVQGTNTGDGDGSRGSRFERSLALARFLTSTQASSARMIAYLPEDVEGHAVLPVLACEEIYAHPEAHLGMAAIDEPLDNTIRVAYQDFAKKRAALPEAVVMAMLDPSVEVNLLELQDGTALVTDQTETQKLDQQGQIRKVDTIWFGGSQAAFTGLELEKYRWIAKTINSEVDLIDALEIKGGLRSASQLPREWTPVQVTISGELSLGRSNQIIRSIASQTEGATGFNLVVFRVDQTECDFRTASRLASYISELNQDEVYTVGLVRESLHGPIGLVATACREAYLLGDAQFGDAAEDTVAFASEDISRDAIQRVLGSLAAESNRPLALLSVLVDNEVTVSEFINQDNGKRAIYADWQVQSQVDAKQWVAKDQIAGEGRIQQSTAIKYRLVDSVAETESLALTNLGIEDQPPELKSPWLDSSIQMLLSQGWLPRLLLTIGFFALMAELGNPGLGAGGLIAGFCFVGFFWIEGLNGNVEWLEVLLFVGGIVALAFELFVIPGFGVFGITGLLMVFVSVVLASQTFIWPTTSAELREVSVNLFWVACLALCGMIGIIFMHKQVERLPLFRWVTLSPEEDIEDLDYRESVAHRDHLLGQTGLTTTRLNPSGKAQFGSTIVAVVGTGKLIAEGVPVTVVEVRGNLVLVEETA